MASQLKHGRFFCLWCVLVLTVLSVSVTQAVILPQEVPNPLEHWQEELPTPESVPGKEYSTDPDTNMWGAPDPGQTVMWDGRGSVWDGIDYCKETEPGQSPGILNFEADEIANCRDKFFLDLMYDRVSIVLSVEDDADIYAHKPTHLGSASSIWAPAAKINSTAVPQDIDGLELWGPDNTPDANMFSKPGDPSEGNGKVSVFRYNDDLDESVPYLYTSVLAEKLVNDANIPAIQLGLTVDQVDVDGLVVWDVADDYVFGPGDIVMFSIKPVGTLFDGGEIWTYTYGDTQARFLYQGGTTWNTTNNVMALLNAPNEDIDALEALPEPATLGLIALGGVGLIRRKR